MRVAEAVARAAARRRHRRDVPRGVVLRRGVMLLLGGQVATVGVVGVLPVK